MVQDLDEFIANEDKLLKARAIRKINDNKEFETLVSRLFLSHLLFLL